VKCPKCQYVGFDATDRCRYCGFEFALATQVVTPSDLPLQTSESGPPVLDPEDLPLLADEVPRPRPAGQPLSVRRSSTEGVRARRPSRPVDAVATPTPLPLDLDLLSPSAEEAGTADGQTMVGRVSPDVRETQPSATAAAAPRIVAALIDLGSCLVVIATLVGATLRVTDLPLTPEGLRLLTPMPLTAVGVLAAMVYQVIGLVACGQTLGKMLMRVGVQMRGGGGIGIDTAVARAALAVAAVASVGLLYLPFVLLPGRRALHDRLTNTEVVVR
jgi:uncharacterized RDD family membrane protein YckC